MLLGLAAEWFFPATSISPRTLEQARELLATRELAPGLRRAVVDKSDDLARGVAIRTAYGGA
ncbi:MAG: hypothetical protein R2731_04620 [Nocardioides sp.]